MKRFAAAAFVLVTVAASLGAEPAGPGAIDARRNQVNTAAMITLGSWALANIGAGTVLSFTNQGSAKHFHEMNALWNTVNLGLAGAGLAGSLRAVPGGELFASIDAQHRLEKILLFNAGLDVGYIMAGLYLGELSRRRADQRDRLAGYGRSLVLQGGFLLGFDLVVYLVQRRSRGLIQEALTAEVGSVP